MQECFGGIEDLPTLVKASQFLQAEGLRYALEANRRRQPRHSGSIPWQFNEPYPNLFCTSAVDYHARPKPAYYAVARAYAPVSVTARFDTMAWEGRDECQAALWVATSLDLTGPTTLTARLVGAGGREHAMAEYQVGSVPSTSAKVGDLAAPLHDVEEVFFLDLTLADGETVLARNRYPFVRGASLAPFLEGHAADVLARVERLGDEWRVELSNTGEAAALGCFLDDDLDLAGQGYAYFSDDYLSLLPGEVAVIRVHWDNAPAGERKLLLSALNLEASTVE
ncbi:MAG TPA: hypothetical protein VNT60_11495 [Deinococcales bacterium]|nr:hypothetical protein [Deinococcales bacterium]